MEDFRASNSLVLGGTGVNVGIGTTAPAERLEVIGTVKAANFSGDGVGLSNVPVGVHGHSAADITSGIVPEILIDSLIARDAEVTALVNTHATRVDNPHATTATQVGAASAVHIHSAADITSGTVNNARFSAYSDLAAEGY